MTEITAQFLLQAYERRYFYFLVTDVDKFLNKYIILQSVTLLFILLFVLEISLVRQLIICQSHNKILP